MASIAVTPMSHEVFMEYKAYAIREWARDSVKGGARNMEHALEWAGTLIDGLLPGDESTANHHLFSITHEEHGKIGYFWMEEVGNVIHARDFEIYAQHRGKGYARLAVSALQALRPAYPHINKVKLEVHAHNKVALELYRKLGFQTYQLVMVKDIMKN